MTPQEKAVIEAAMDRFSVFIIDETDMQDLEITRAVHDLIYSCPQCNGGGHTCPGDGNPIGHTATDCGRHQDDMPGTVVMPLAPELVTPTSFKVVAVRQDDPAWVETTMTNCLINDRIRIGQEETTVLRSTHGLWHVDTSDYWTPRAWEHVELRMELEAVPGLKQYPPSASIEIACTPERLAVLRIQEGFPGSAVTSSHVD